MKSAAHHACRQASVARQVLEHVISMGGGGGGGHAAGSGREATTVDLSHDSVSLRSLRMKKTMASEIVQIEPW